ncbi:Hsp70 family chaperone [Apiospora marii]|uniref:Hsp70 family chaperone n=1 Tax=Apiospora marii TaxID=335849 RepID=A0ABR1S607_9PEZI
MDLCASVSRDSAYLEHLMDDVEPRLFQDLCLINVHNVHVGKLSIDAMSAPVGENVGSSHIDRMFEQLAEDRLRNLSYEVKPTQEWGLGQLSYAMRNDADFEASKKALDSTKAASSEYFTVGGPDLSMYQDKDLSSWVHNGRIKFDFRELAGLFDNVIDDRTVTINGHRNTLPGINMLIQRARTQIRDQQRTSSIDVDIILLSGGLGQSRYLKHRVEQALEKDQDAGTQPPRVVTMDEPQLCVCKGLLYNRKREIFRGQRCNGNYGILQLTKFNRFNLRHRIGSLDIHQLLTVRFTTCLGRDSVAEVRCDLGELAEDAKSEKRYCEVELILNIGKFDGLRLEKINDSWECTVGSLDKKYAETGLGTVT